LTVPLFPFEAALLGFLELCFGTAIEDHKLRQNPNAADEQSL
jgi:hypothetical protein